MNSIRTKTTLLAVCAVVVAIAIATVLGVVAIRNVGSSSADQTLLLLCESGEKNLDFYFESVEQAVEMVSTYVQSDLEEMEPDGLADHLERVKDIFEKLTYKTVGVLTYYYRIDPAVSAEDTGFWFVNLDGEGFEEHTPTDITQYDTTDTSQLVWFTVPKNEGKAIWLAPYVTDNLNVRVISYNVPVYRNGTFIGVVGIEIDYSTMAEQVDHITLYENGYAFLNDAEGTIIYHPRMDVTVMEKQPKVPSGLLSDETFIHYEFEGVEKQAVWLELINGMRLNVTVPVEEINADWQKWVRQILVISAVLLVLVAFACMRFTEGITKPLRELTEVAELVNAGDYDTHLEYDGKDEVGILTKAFNKLTAHLKSYIGNLNDLAYADALTGVHNKGAFDIYMQKLQTTVNEAEEKPKFAIVMFDCNGLKKVNDSTGHDKGNEYLKLVCSFICRAFSHSPVFRIGGDEFVAVLQGGDLADREALLRRFDEQCEAKRTEAEQPWEKVSVARGVAVYDPQLDEDVNDVFRRADKLMYENKWGRGNAAE